MGVALEFKEGDEAVKRQLRVGRPGQFRLDTRTRRPVKLIQRIYKKLKNGSTVYRCDWLVEDVLSGKRYPLNMLKWSDESLNAMEVLAWVSK